MVKTSLWTTKDYLEYQRKKSTYTKIGHKKSSLQLPEKGKFPTWNWLIEKIQEQFIYGVDIFVIDAFNKLEYDGSKDSDLVELKVLTQLTMFAQMNNVIIFLVVHPTKMQKSERGIYNVPTLYDCSGSADFRNQTHDGFTIYRHFESVNDGHFDIDKNPVGCNQKVKKKRKNAQKAKNFQR